MTRHAYSPGCLQNQEGEPHQGLTCFYNPPSGRAGM
jgi:hypothetical protein